MENIFVCTPSQLKDLFLDFQKSITQVIQDYLKKENTSKEWLTAREVCELLNISNTTLHEWSNQGILKKYKIGRPVRFRSDELEEAFTRVESRSRKS